MYIDYYKKSSRKKGNGTIYAILLVAAILLVVWFGRDMGFNFNVHILYWIFGTNNIILLVPSAFSCNFGGIFVLAFILVTPFVIYLYFHVFDSLSKNKVKDRIKLFTSISLVLIIILILTYSNCTIFYEDKIINKNIFNINGKEYSYNEISKVEIYSTSFRGNPVVHYDLKMIDGLVININTLRYSIKNIKRYDKFNFNNLFYIDDKIKKDIPHFITSSAYEELLDEGVSFPDKVKNRFTFEDNN